MNILAESAGVRFHGFQAKIFGRGRFVSKIGRCVFLRLSTHIQCDLGNSEKCRGAREYNCPTSASPRPPTRVPAVATVAKCRASTFMSLRPSCHLAHSSLSWLSRAAATNIASRRCGCAVATRRVAGPRRAEWRRSRRAACPRPVRARARTAPRAAPLVGARARACHPARSPSSGRGRRGRF